MLVEKDNCNISPKDNDGMTPLHIACQEGRTKVVTCLLARGAEVDHKNAQACTPLNLAVTNGHKEAVELLLSK